MFLLGVRHPTFTTLCSAAESGITSNVQTGQSSFGKITHALCIIYTVFVKMLVQSGIGIHSSIPSTPVGLSQLKDHHAPSVSASSFL